MPDIGAADGAGQNLASFGQDYAVTLRNLAGPVRQLADLRSSLPGAALTAASDAQRELERETARLPGHSDARSTAQHLVRLTSEILSEVAEHQAARDEPAARPGQVPGNRVPAEPVAAVASARCWRMPGRGGH